MNRSRRAKPRGHHGLVYLACLALSLGALIVACSDDEPDVATTGAGAGGSSDGGNPFGGFGMGPSGPGPGSGGGGNGGEGNQGGTADPGFEWSQRYATAAGGTVFPKDVAIDSGGNIIVVGSYTGVVNLGGSDLPEGGLTDVFVAKYDDTGAHVWSYGGGDAEVQGANSVTTDSSNNIWLTGIVKGTFTFPNGSPIDQGPDQFQNCWIAKLDANGGELFSASYDAAADQNCDGVAVDVGPSDEVLLGGTFGESLAIGAGLSGTGLTMFLTRYSSTFTINFEAAYGGAGVDEATAVAHGSDGSMAIGGTADDDITFGNTLTNGAGEPRAVVAKLNAAGQEQFAYLFDSGGEAAVVDLAFHDNGDLFVVGEFRETIDLGGGEISASGGAKEVFVARLDAGGNLVYGTRFGGTGTDEPYRIAVNGGSFATVVGRMNDDIVVNGETTLTYDSTANDAFVIQAGPPGQGYWGFNTKALNTAQARAVAVDPTDDTVVVAGQYSDQLDLGAGAVGSGDSGGMFLIKFSASP